MIEAEAEVRRRLAESIHDGPVQELSSVDMMLAAAEQALERGDATQARAASSEARALTERNIRRCATRSSSSGRRRSTS